MSGSVNALDATSPARDWVSSAAPGPELTQFLGPLTSGAELPAFTVHPGISAGMDAAKFEYSGSASGSGPLMFQATGSNVGLVAAADPVMLTQEQVDQFESGLGATLAGIAANLTSQVFADTLPVLGNNLFEVANSGATQLAYVTTLKDAIVAGLGSLSGSATYSEAQVEAALNTALTGFGTANLNLANLNDITLSFATTKSLGGLTVPLEGDLGLPGLGLATSGSAQSTLGYTLNFGTGLDAGGFYLNTAPGQANFRVTADTRLPGFSAGAELSSLNFTASDNAATPSRFDAAFTIALKDANNDGHLRPGELGGDLLDAMLSGNAAINLTLASNLGTAVLPDLAANLSVNWGFGNAVVNPAVGSASFGNVPTVTFKNVSLGLGSFFSDFVDPVLDAVQVFTDPLQPIVDVLQTKIGFLSELAGQDVTLLDVAGGIGALSPESAARIELYADLISFINAPRDGGTTRIDLGDFSIGAQDPRGALFDLANVVPQSIRNAIAPGSQNGGLGGFLAEKNALPGGGLSFPIIEDPTTAINLLFGKSVDFFSYHVPGLDLDGIGFDQFYRLFGPFGVRLTATVEAHAFLDLGYDSSGIAQFAASGDAGDIFNGFFVVDQPGAEGTLTANLQAFAAFNVIFAEAGVGGGIIGNLNASLEDRDFNPGDGRIHFAELSNSCIFTLSGEVTAGLSAYLTVGFGPFSETFERNFGHEVLTSFNVSGCDVAGIPGVPVLAHNTGATVALHVGMDASLRQIGTLEDSPEDFGVVHISGSLGSEVVATIGNGLLNEDGTPVLPQNSTVGVNGRITADGGDKDDNLELAPDVLSPATLRGGVGNDRLVGGAGDDALFGDAGLDLLVGGAGADTLNGGGDQDFLDGQDDDDFLFGGGDGDFLLGGAGADVLDGGPGFDTATYLSAPIGVLLNLGVPGSGTGDAQGDTYISIERIVGSSHADIFFGTTGSENFGGGAGDDVLDGREGDDLLVGDAGADTLTGGVGNDFAAYTLSLAAVNVSLLTGQGSGGDAAGDILSGIENLQGSEGGDTLEGDHGANWLRGLHGANTLRGLGGDDLLEGGKDNDALDGGDGNDALKASQEPASTDALVSGGIDTLLGGAGNDLLFGDSGGDTLDGGADADSIFGGRDGDTIFGRGGDDVISGGAGHDAIDAGDGLNVVSGDDGDDLITAGSGPDQLAGGAGHDVIHGGAGLNLLNGGTGNDVLTALGDSDALHGDDGDDQLNAGDGANVLTGGTGVDVLVSGSGPDTLHGGADHDTASSGAGNDLVFGEDGNDLLDAGIGSDRVDGGAGDDFLSVGALREATQDPERNDHLFGGAGFDTITADFSNQTVVIAVTAGATQSLSFADGTEALDFENVHDFFTGSGDDVLRLDGAADDHFGNLLKTGAGNDTIYSGTGSDDVDAGDGDDFVNGGKNDAVLTAGDIFGTINGFTGPGETLAGGLGIDTLSFEGFAKYPTDVPGIQFGVDINLATNQTRGAATGITISGFENVIGTDYADYLTGDSGPNFFNPLHGGGYTHSSSTSGPDRIDGGGGLDTIFIDFSREDLPSSSGITSGSTGYGRQTPGSALWYSDSFSVTAVEQAHIIGASKNDQITGLIIGFNDILSGLGGNDILGGNSGSDVLLGGADNDVLTGQGSYALDYSGVAGGHDVFDGGAGDDLVEDIAFVFGGPILGADALFQLDGGAGFDTLSVDFSNQTVPIIWDSAAPENLEFTDGAFARNFEQLRYFATGPGDDVIAQRDRMDNRFYLGDGNDTINPGLGVDSVDGGAGFDVAIFDFSVGDTPEMAGITGYGSRDGVSIFRPLVADFFNRPDNVYIVKFERVQITGTSKADTIGGTYGDDTLFGGDGNDTLDGYFGGSNLLDGGDGDDALTGAYPNYPGPGTGGGNDTLLGGPGADILFGNHGNDLLVGGDGDDVISAGDRNVGGGYVYGVDVIDGGAGNDVITDGLFRTDTNATAGDRLQLDGGAGFDRLSADFGKQTAPIHFDGVNPTSTNFPDGSYFRNFEMISDFISGSGNDVLIQPGRVDNLFFAREGNDVVNPGLGIDFASGGAGDDLLILDYSTGDDANVSGVTFEVQYFRRRDLGSGALLDSIYTGEFEHFQITGGSKADELRGGDFSDTLRGGAGNDTIDAGYGNDLLDGGLGADTLRGSLGDDTYVVDHIADIVVENAGSGNDTVNAIVDYNLGPSVENLFLGGRALSGIGNALANVIAGNARNNFLQGGDGADVLTGGSGAGLAGSREVDRLSGDAGADTFVLGDVTSRFYDDRSSLSPGTSGYAWIDDFTPSAGDRLQLKGSAADYFLATSPVAGVPGLGLFHDTDADGVFDAGFDELLAILDSPDALTPTNTIDAAIFV